MSFIRDLPERQLRPYKRKDGYLQVALRKDGKYHGFLVHRLVLEAFVESCPEGMECLHRDGDKSNNHVSNLSWGTRQSNMDDSKRLNTVAHGEKNFNAKLTAKQVLLIVKMLKTGKSQTEIGREFGVCNGTIHLIAKGVNWRRLTRGLFDKP
jgi:hypothetical protein